MAHASQLKTVTNLKHVTAPRTALHIARSKVFLSSNPRGHYDGGVNFLGVLGQMPNTNPRLSGARLTCTWTGQVSVPLPYDAHGADTPNILYDFNGSDAVFNNNDPRYFLAYDSKGLVLNTIDFENDEALLEGWCYLRGGFCAWAYENNWFRKLLLTWARKYVDKLNRACESGQVRLFVRYGSA